MDVDTTAAVPVDPRQASPVTTTASRPKQKRQEHSVTVSLFAERYRIWLNVTSVPRKPGSGRRGIPERQSSQ